MKRQHSTKATKDEINQEINNERGWNTDWYDDENWPVLLREIDVEIDLCKYGQSDWTAEIYWTPKPITVTGRSIEEAVCLSWLKWLKMGRDLL